MVRGADLLELEIFSGPWRTLDPQHCEHRHLVSRILASTKSEGSSDVHPYFEWQFHEIIFMIMFYLMFGNVMR